MSDTPAGWHPDPEQPGSLRYWDGTQWTEHRQPAAAQPTPPPPAMGGYQPQPYGMPGPTPFVPTGGPAPSGGSGCAKAAIIGIIVVVLVGGVVAVGGILLANKAVKTISRTFGTADTSDYTVSVTSCGKTESSNEITASGTFKNRANRRQAYRFTVEADDQNGNRIGYTSHYIAALAHNQSAAWSESYLGELPPGAKAKCTVTEVNYWGVTAQPPAGAA